MNELKITVITFAICAIIIILASLAFKQDMVQFLVGMLTFLVIKREVKEWWEK